MTNTPDILKTILAKKEEEVARRKIQTPIEMLQDIAMNVENHVVFITHYIVKLR